jgi:O-antigen/teichoic acid export membrane protein
MFSLLGVVIIPVGFLITPFLLVLFQIPSHLTEEATTVFVVAIVIFALSNIQNIFVGFLSGLQKMALLNKIVIFMTIPNILGTVFFLEAGYGLSGLMLNNTIILFMHTVILLIASKSIFPELKFHSQFFHRDMLKRLLSLGFKLQVIRGEEIIIFQTDKLLLSHFVGFNAVAYYQLGSMIINKSREFSGLIISAILPAISEIHAMKDAKRMHDLYWRGTRYLAVVAMPLLIGVAFTAHLIMKAWMKEGYDQSVLLIQILAPCYIINILSSIPVLIALGMERPEFQVKAALFQLVLNLLLSFFLVRTIGFSGVVIATLISLSLSSAWMIAVFHRFVNYSLKEYISRLVILPLLLSLGAGIFICAVNSIIGMFHFPASRFVSLAVLLVDCGIFGGVFFTGIVKSGYINRDDMIFFRQKVPFISLLEKRFF